MPCPHRFLNYHAPGLFPNWEVMWLFIGTYNPSWDNPNGHNADYFYGRSKYMWKLLPRFYGGPDLTDSTVEQKVSFCQQHGIGFTDLIFNITNADEEVEQDRSWIYTYRDLDLLNFGNGLQFQTQAINEYINQINPKGVYTTLLGQNVGAIKEALDTIEATCQNRHFCRLHTHTGQGLGPGAPRENKLTNRWHEQGLIPTSPAFDVQHYHWE